MKQKIKQRQNQLRRQRRENTAMFKDLKCNDERFDFDHCSDIKNHISPLVKVIER